MITLRILLEKPGYQFTKAAVDIPIKFMDNDEIRDLISRGYYFAGTKVIES
jgi:hypothetical protein